MATCEECKTDKITEKVEEFSKKSFQGKVLCFNCQKKARTTTNSKPTEQPQVKQELVCSVDKSQLEPAFIGMVMNHAWQNAREYEKTYEEAKRSLHNYFNDALLLALELKK